MSGLGDRIAVLHGPAVAASVMDLFDTAPDLVAEACVTHRVFVETGWCLFPGRTDRDQVWPPALVEPSKAAPSWPALYKRPRR